MLYHRHKDTVTALLREFEAVIAQADKEIPVLENSLTIIPSEFTFHSQIQDHINVLVDARLRARHYLRIIAGNAEVEVSVVGWTPPIVNRIEMEPPSPEEPTSGGGDA